MASFVLHLGGVSESFMCVLSPSIKQVEVAHAAQLLVHDPKSQRQTFGALPHAHTMPHHHLRLTVACLL